MTSPASPTRHSRWPLRDLPVLLWLLAAVTAALLRASLPQPHWLALHLLMLGAVSHAIMVWSRHFAEALLHTGSRDGDHRAQASRLLLLNGGTVGVLAGVLADWLPLTVLGATAVAVAVTGHGIALARRTRRALPGRFSSTVRYYVAAACFLPVGAILGTTLAGSLPERLHEQVAVAHATVNLLGWVGLTVVGTLVTLWPTILRTRIPAGAERAAQRALPLLVVAVLVAAGSALAGVQLLAAAGLLGYLAGLGLTARPFAAAARSRPPSSYPAASVLSGVCWLLGCLAVLTVGIATAPSWLVAGDRLGAVVPYLAVGFGTQVLLGALSYLLPMALAGGPAPVRAANAVMDRAWPVRIAGVNAALLACALPVPGPVRTAAAAVVLAGLASFLPLLLLSLRAAQQVRRAAVSVELPSLPRPPGRGGAGVPRSLG
jgi:nitrite reductase (NO-forming)